MSIFKIISKDSQSIRYEGAPQYNGAYLGVDYIEFRTISSPSIIDWEIGDYVDYFRTGKRYKLYSLPMPKKVARVGSYGGAIEYSNVQFFAATKDLEIAPFKDLVSDDNGVHFSTRPDVSTTEDVYGIARRIEACLNDMFPNRWKINVYESDDENLNALLAEKKEFSVSQGSCLDALAQIYDTWKGVGWIHTTDAQSGKEIITIGRANVRDAGNTTDLFTYGVGNGLTSIKKAAANEGEFATRLYVYGSNRNLPARYYNHFDIVDKDSADIQNLMIPIGEWGLTDGIPDPSKAYLQADDALIEKYGLIPKAIYFDGANHEEIYPSITGLTRKQVRDAMIAAGDGDSEYIPSSISGADDYRIDEVGLVSDGNLDEGTREDYEANPNINISLREMGFNIAEQGKNTSAGYAVISMKSGPCEGREFRVRKYVGPAYGSPLYGERIYNIEKSWDDSLGMSFPNRIFPINRGDQFVLLDIPMPDFYVTINSQKLLEKGRQMLADYTRVSAFYEPGVNAIRMKEIGGVITPGMFMQIEDKDIIDTNNHKDYVLIDSISIDENSEIPTYRITLREQKRAARSYSVLEEMIEDAKEGANQAIKRERQYTDRRFRSSQETLQMLESAFTNFSKGITPATVKTMALLIGDESLQYKFTASRESLTDVPCPLSWSGETKQMIGVPASLIHMTLGVEGIVPSGTRVASDYKSWSVVSWWDKETFKSEFLEDADKSYYVYVKASKDSADAWYFLDEDSHEMIEDDAYYFLVGILNSEYDGNRDFVTLYGFTEVLPGQITTDVIRSGDGRTYFDLQRGVISGDIHFIAPDGSDKSMSDFADEQKAEFSKVDKNVQNLQDQIDGVVENHFYEGTPTTSNYPASEWVTDEQKINHIGDTYTDISEIESDPNAGKSWRWCRCDDMTGITDYVEATDKDGVTYKLHWHPIADTDAVKALLKVYELERKVDDAEYLKETFKKGETSIGGGVVMTEMVAVRNNEEKIEAFLNGSDFASIPNHYGKLILASGIPDTTASGSTDLAERAKEANTRLYEDGHFETKNMVAHGGVFNDIKVTGSMRSPFVRGVVMIDGDVLYDNFYNYSSTAVDGVELSRDISQSGRKITLTGNFTVKCPNGYIYDEGKAYYNKNIYVGTIREAYEGYTLGKEKVTLLAIRETSTTVAWVVTDRRLLTESECSNVAYHGQFAGLRPRLVRNPKDSGYTNRYTISTLDHTIVFEDGASGNFIFYLPANPELGQHYEIIRVKASRSCVFKTTDSKKIFRIDNVNNDIEQGISSGWGGKVELTYDGAQWVMVLMGS